MNILQTIQRLFAGIHLVDHDIVIFLLGFISSGLVGRLSLRKAYHAVRHGRRAANNIIP